MQQIKSRKETKHPAIWYALNQHLSKY